MGASRWIGAVECIHGAVGRKPPESVLPREIPVPRVVSQRGGKWVHPKGLMWVWGVFLPPRTT